METKRGREKKQKHRRVFKDGAKKGEKKQNRETSTIKGKVDKRRKIDEEGEELFEGKRIIMEIKIEKLKKKLLREVGKKNL